MLERANLILKNKEFLDNYESIKTSEKNRKFCNHDIEHLLSVARIMVIRDLELQENPTDRDIIYAIALLHDIGRSEQYNFGIDHNISGAIIANSILKSCEYSYIEITSIIEAIENHNNDKATTYLSKLLQYADHKSRNCFVCEARSECNWDEERKNKEIEI
jgi:uncharacterized protein